VTVIRAGSWGFVLVLVGAVAPALAAPPTAGDMVAVRCKIEYRTKTLIGCSLYGVLRDCLVRPGDRVVAGQPLGHLQDEDVRAELDIQEARARSDLAIRVSEAKLAFLQGKLKTSERLYQRGILSSEDFGLQKLETETARITVEDERFKRGVAALEYRRAQAMVKLREIASPTDGIVVDVLKSPGEGISTTNDPIFRVVDPRWIKATGFVDVGDAWRVQVGQQVLVQADIPGVDLPVERIKYPGLRLAQLYVG